MRCKSVSFPIILTLTGYRHYSLRHHFLTNIEFSSMNINLNYGVFLMKKILFAMFLLVSMFIFTVSAYALDKGAQVKNFTLTDISGKSVSLSDYKGKVVVLNFWASWCPPCKAEMPEFDQMDKEFKKSGSKAVLLAVNMTDGRRETKSKVEKFLSETKYGMRVLLDTEGKVAEMFSVRYLPTTYVIDTTGKVSGQLVGGTTKDAVMQLVREAK